MNLQLMREFEEFEGLGNQVLDDATIAQENEDDDPSFRPAQASALTSNDIYYEVRNKNYTLLLSCKFRFLRCGNNCLVGQTKHEDDGLPGYR